MSKTIREQLGADLRNARLSAGITQEQLEETTGISQGYISDVEIGRRNITFDSAITLADALDLEIVVITRARPKQRQ